MYGVLTCVYKLMTIIFIIFITSSCNNTGSVLQTQPRTFVLFRLDSQLWCMQTKINSNRENMERWGQSGVWRKGAGSEGRRAGPERGEGSDGADVRLCPGYWINVEHVNKPTASHKGRRRHAELLARTHSSKWSFWQVRNWQLEMWCALHWHGWATTFGHSGAEGLAM